MFIKEDNTYNDIREKSLLQWLCSTTPQTAAAESLDTDLVAEIRLYVDCLRSQWALQETPETPQRPKAA